MGIESDPVRHPGLVPGATGRQAVYLVVKALRVAQWTPAQGRGDEEA